MHTLIGHARVTARPESVEQGVERGDGVGHASALFAHPGLRMKLTFFDPPAEDKERPSYKVDMTVNEAGVTTAMVLEYTDFSVEAAIAKIEELPRPRCAGR